MKRDQIGLPADGCGRAEHDFANGIMGLMAIELMLRDENTSRVRVIKELKEVYTRLNVALTNCRIKRRKDELL